MSLVETEVKFLIRDLPGIAKRLEAAGAQLTRPEVLEVNLRFDRPDGSLRNSLQVLRLRRDSRSRLTYKGPPQLVDGVGARTEIEFEVSDLKAAQAFLEALDFQIVWVYEKLRTTYSLDGVEVVLDRTPLGDFAELEGPGGAEIMAVARHLGLDWEARSLSSYSVLFEAAKANLGLDMRDMTFESFEGIQVDAAALGARPAD